MADEVDELIERAGQIVESMDRDLLFKWSNCVRDLVDAIRALRKDREILNAIESLADGGRYGWSHSGKHRFVLPHLIHRSQSPQFDSFRESIAAAMAAESARGEGQ